MPQPELIINQGTTTTTPPADATIADLRAALAAADERFATLLFRANADVERAEADAAALRDAIQRTLAECPFCQVGRCRSEAHQWLRTAAAEHPGEALPAELAAARAIVESVRPVRAWLPRLIALYAAYDAAVQARTE